MITTNMTEATWEYKQAKQLMTNMKQFKVFTEEYHYLSFQFVTEYGKLTVDEQERLGNVAAIQESLDIQELYTRYDYRLRLERERVEGR